MTLRFNVFGYTVATIDLAIHQAYLAESVSEHPIVEGGIDALSGWWVERMLKRRKR